MRHAAPPDAAVSQQAVEELPTWDLGDLYPGPNSPAVEADLTMAEQAARAFAAAHQHKLGAMSGRARGGDLGVRANRGTAGQVDVLCAAAVRGRFHQRGDRPLLPDRERAGDHD